MVSQYRVHSILGLELGKDGHELVELGGQIVHQIACKHNEVGIQGIHLVYRLLQALGVTRPATCMDVRQLHDAVSLETLRHIGRGNGHIPYHKVLLAIQGAEHQVSEGVEGNASGQPTLVEAAMELAGYEAQQQGGKCKDGLGHTDAEEKDEEGAHHVHGVRTRFEPAKDGYHAQQEDKGGQPIDAAHPFVGALADVGAVDVPVGQRHQGEEEEEQL